MNIYKLGYVLAKTKFDMIKLFKCHFKMCNCVVVSFRKDKIVIQTLNSSIVFSTVIPIESLEEYECDFDEINVMVTKNLVAREAKSKYVSVVKYWDEGRGNYHAEVTFDLIFPEDAKYFTKVTDSPILRSFGVYLDPYGIFLIDSSLNVDVKEGFIVPNERNRIIVETPNALKMLCYDNLNLLVQKDRIGVKGLSINMFVSLKHNEIDIDFIVANHVLKKLLKFLPSRESTLEIFNASEFKLRFKYYFTNIFICC